MRRWVWTAGAERLRHLGLVRRSDVSRGFARGQLFLLAVVSALLLAGDEGRHRVERTPDNASLLVTEPEGNGWIRIAVAEDGEAVGCVAVWWNPTRGALSFVVGLAGGLLVAYGLLGAMGLGASMALGASYRGEERLGAALDYSLAWGHPAAWAGLLMVAVFPVLEVLQVAGVGPLPPVSAVSGGASVIALGSGLLWWFWLVRLGYTGSESARVRMTVFMAVVVPVLAVGMLVCWRVGMGRLFDAAWGLLHLRWER